VLVERPGPDFPTTRTHVDAAVNALRAGRT
jgi:hypothetical protein